MSLMAKEERLNPSDINGSVVNEIIIYLPISLTEKPVGVWCLSNHVNANGH